MVCSTFTDWLLLLDPSWMILQDQDGPPLMHRVRWYYYATMVVAMAYLGGGAGGLGFFPVSFFFFGLKCRPAGGMEGCRGNRGEEGCREEV